MSSLRSRTLSALVALAVLWVVVWAGLPLMIPAVLVVSYLALGEYVGLLRRHDIDVRRNSLLLFAVLILAASYPNLPIVPWIGGSWREVVLTVAISLATSAAPSPSRATRTPIFPLLCTYPATTPGLCR